MYCKQCGKVISDQSRFCGYCGAPVLQDTVCPACGARIEENQMFCVNCGTRIGRRERQASNPAMINGFQNQTAARNSGSGNAENQGYEGRKNTSSGALLRSVKLVSLYEGEPTVGIAKATGNLNIYDDRIEFAKKMGNSAVSMMGVLGIAVAAAKASDEIFEYRNLAGIRTGKYGGVYNTLVLTTTAGRTVSFVPAVPGSGIPGEIVNLVQPYLF